MDWQQHLEKLALILMCSFPLIVISSHLFKSIRDGGWQGKFRNFSRKDTPGSYWFGISFFSLVVFVCLLALVAVLYY